MECVKIYFAPGAEPFAARSALEKAIRSVNRAGLWPTLYLDFFAFVDEPELPEAVADDIALPESVAAQTPPLIETVDAENVSAVMEMSALPESAAAQTPPLIETVDVENVSAVVESLALPESPFFGVLLSTEISPELLREVAARTDSAFSISFAPLTLADAEAIYREAVETCRGEEAALAQMSAACEHFSLLLFDTRRATEAENLCREALDGYRRLLQKRAGTADAVAGACYHLARILYSGSNTQEAETLYCEALDIYRELSKRNSDYQAPLARTCQNLALCLEECGRPEAAEWFQRNALDIYRKLAERDAEAYAPYVAAACGNLAAALKSSGRAAEAAGLYRVALNTYTKLVRENPAKWEPTLGFLYENLAAFEFARAPEAGRALLRSAWMLYQKYPDLSAEAERVQAQLREWS